MERIPHDSVYVKFENYTLEISLQFEYAQNHVIKDRTREIEGRGGR